MGIGDNLKKMRAHIESSRIARAAGAMGRGLSSAYTAAQRASFNRTEDQWQRKKARRESRNVEAKNINAETKLINARLKLARAQKKQRESGQGRGGIFGSRGPPFMNDGSWPPDSGRKEAPPGLRLSKSSADLPLPFGKRKKTKEVRYW